MLKYKLKRMQKKKLIIWSTMILLFFISMGSIVKYYAAGVVFEPTDIAGDTLIVNDLNDDWNYYMGLNYTEITDKNNLPGINATNTAALSSNKYSQDSLVAVQINYDGTDINDSTKSGYLEYTEDDANRKNKLMYLKYIPIVDGKLKIELIDNPFTQRPENRAFNSWVCDTSRDDGVACEDLVFSYDDDRYLRYVTIDAPTEVDDRGFKKVVINLKTSWTAAKIASTTSSISTVFEPKGMASVGEPIYGVVPGMGFSGTFKIDRVYCEVRIVPQGTDLVGAGCLAPNWVFNYYICQEADGCECFYRSNNSDPFTQSDPNIIFYIMDSENKVFRPATRDDFDNVEDLPNLEQVIIGYKSDFEDGELLVGYYYLTTYDSNNSELFYNEAGVQCSVSGANCGTEAYKMIQHSDPDEIKIWRENEETQEDGTVVEKPVNDPDKYFYLSTRDTNIFDLSLTNSTFSTSTFANYSYPMTVTGNHSGDYEGETITSAAMSLKDDMVFENLTFVGMAIDTSDPRNNLGTGNSVVANYKNFKIARTVDAGNNNMVFSGVRGGTSSTPSSGSDITGKIMIEAGYYRSFLTQSNSSVTNEEVIFQVGNDYDRVTGDNSNLRVSYQIAASTGGNHNSTLIKPTSLIILKSGTIGSGILDSTNSYVSGVTSYFMYGIYVGARYSGSSNSLRSIKIEGGRVLFINGGPSFESGYRGNVVSIYMTGGTVDNIVGGAGQDTTDGNRLISITGGQVKNSIAGGSNSYVTESSSDGLVRGNTLVYVGGDAHLGGTPSKVQSSTNSTLVGIETPGSVFGAGLGNSPTSTRIGVVYNSHVIIDGNAVIDGSVFGGGNYGSTGAESNYNTFALVDILGGTVNGSVFGSANRNGAGYNNSGVNYGNIANTGSISNTKVVDFYHDIIINMNDGKVLGSIYGGSNASGISYADVTINLYKGNINATDHGVYGGGKGASTVLGGSTTINVIPDNDSDLNIYEIYGGSELGKANVNGNADVNVNGGIINSVYGGGKGATSTVPYSYGNIDVTIENGTIVDVYGGTNLNGSVPYSGKTMRVNVNDGEITNVFGGSNGSRASATNTYVGINGGVINNVYGGGNRAVVSGTTDVDITQGDIQNAFGGGNEATVETSNISITGGSIALALYGGGNKARVNTTNVNVSGGTFAQASENLGMGLGVFGGGANVSGSGANNTNVVLQSGVNVYNVYGGSNMAGTVTGTATVNSESANIGCNLYGGGYQAAINNSNVSINGSTTFAYTLNADASETAYNTTCGMAFGGGASADVNTASNITLNTTGKLIALYGGSNKAGNVAKSTVNVERGVVSAVFGGNNYDGATGNTNVTINQGAGTLTIDNVFGGSNGQEAIVGFEDGNGVFSLGSTNVIFNSGTVNENIFGGGNEAPVFGNTNVSMTGGTAYRVYGGGNKAFVGDLSTSNVKFEKDPNAETGEAQSKVNLSGGRVKNNVYGSGNASFIDGNTYVNLASSSETATNTKTLRIDGSVFGGSETNADEDKTYQYKSIGVSGDSTITVDGTGYFDSDGLSTVKINGSIHGGGNNSATRGTAKLYIDKLGARINANSKEEDVPMSMASIQRFNNVYIKDSILELNGARDRSLQTRYTYGFVRIDNLYLLGTTASGNTLNGSTLYMSRGNILLKKYYSGAMTDDYKSFVAQTTSENANGILTNGNSNNKLYMYENIVFAVSTKDEILYDSSAGVVRGMTFLGMYNHGVNGDELLTGIYDTAFEEGDVVGNVAYSQITSDAYTYAYGLHEYEPEYQIVNHGFYTNKVDEEQVVNVDYVGVTPLNLDYYKWVIGKEKQQILVDLEASKNSTRESQNVKITLDQLKEQIGNETFEWRDATMLINTVDTSTFKAAKDDTIIEFDTILVDQTEINAVNIEDKNGDGVVDANNYFALTMGTSARGWLDNYRTSFYENGYVTEGDFCTDGSIGDCKGNSKYVYDSTTLQRGLTFWLDHAKNLDFSVSTATERENAIISLGTVTIRTVFTNPHADPSSANQQVDVDIVITITMTDSTRDVYGAAIAPGIKTKVFSSENTSIPTDGIFSIYQSLALDLNQPMMKDKTKMWDVNHLYGQDRTDANGDHYSESYRYLASNYLFPKGTKITLLDLVMNEQYYYEVTQSNQDEVLDAADGSPEYKYMLENFVRMGSTSTNNKYDDDMNGDASTKYYINENDGKIKFAIEEFVFNVDFSAVDPDDMIDEVKQFYLYMQLSHDKNGSEAILLNPDGDPTEDMSYILNPDITSKLESTGKFVVDGKEEDTAEIYMGDEADLKLYTTLINKRADGTTASGVTNTTYEKYKLGAKLTIMRPARDEQGNVIVDANDEIVYEQITGDMFGTVFTINGQKYYPQIDGTTRIQLAGRISDVISDINIDFSNSSLGPGDYKILIETFASYDGLYYGDADVVPTELSFTMLNNQYGLNVIVPPEQITHDVNNGLDKNNSNIINYIVETKNGVADPYLRISLQRRNYNSYFENSYTNVDLKKIATSINIGSDATNALDICYKKNNDNCDIYTLVKMDSAKLTENFEVNMTLKEGPTVEDLRDLSVSGWKSGTYRVVFTLYDGDVPVGSVYEYMIIRSLDVGEIIEGS